MCYTDPIHKLKPAVILLMIINNAYFQANNTKPNLMLNHFTQHLCNYTVPIENKVWLNNILYKQAEFHWEFMQCYIIFMASSPRIL